jgi:hypothetical protein
MMVRNGNAFVDWNNIFSRGPEYSLAYELNIWKPRFALFSQVCNNHCNSMIPVIKPILRHGYNKIKTIQHSTLK